MGCDILVERVRKHQVFLAAAHVTAASHAGILEASQLLESTVLIKENFAPGIRSVGNPANE